MNGVAIKKWFVYHVYDGKVVVDECESIPQLEAHYAGDPKFTRQYVAGLMEPMGEKMRQGFIRDHGHQFDDSKRGAIKAYTAPAATARKQFSVRMRANRKG